MSRRLLRIPDWEGLAKEAKFQPATIAALCPISLRQLRRFFKEQFDKTPKQWTRELRCRLAIELICKGWSNKAVAEELGYADECHFCHEFKRVYGCSPQNYAPLHGVDRAKSISFLQLPAAFAARRCSAAAGGAAKNQKCPF